MRCLQCISVIPRVTCVLSVRRSHLLFSLHLHTDLQPDGPRHHRLIRPLLCTENEHVNRRQKKTRETEIKRVKSLRSAGAAGSSSSLTLSITHVMQLISEQWPADNLITTFHYKSDPGSDGKFKLDNFKMWLWTTKAVISNTGIFVAIANNTLYGSKLYIFMPQIIRILSKDHVPWRY